MNPVRKLRRLWKRKAAPVPSYKGDDLCVWNRNLQFLHEKRFVEAYQRGIQSGQKFGGERNLDVHIEWRVHVICWAASHALHLPGDFVECGVNTGIFSLALAHFIDLNATGKYLYLFDTFAGIPPEQISERERSMNRCADNERMYEDCFEVAKKNFAPYPKARLVRGKIPDSLSQVSIEQVCYLSIDMNIVAPEIAAITHFWEKLVPGALVILDDYGWKNYATQKEAMDQFAASRGVNILTCPTGQGILIKPPG